MMILKTLSSGENREKKDFKGSVCNCNELVKRGRSYQVVLVSCANISWMATLRGIGAIPSNETLVVCV